jgi:hypothetical protein
MSYQSINVKLTPTTANRPAEHEFERLKQEVMRDGFLMLRGFFSIEAGLPGQSARLKLSK